MVGAVDAAFGGEVAGGRVSAVGDGFHEFVIEIDRFRRCEAESFFEEGVLEAHDAEADGAVAEVGTFGGFGRVEVDVDDVIQGADGDVDGFTKHIEVEGAVVFDMSIEDDRAEVADGGFVFGGIEGDFRAEVRGVDDSGVILRGAEVAGIFEGDPGMAGFKNHFEHGLPEVDGWEGASVDFSFGGEGFVVGVAFLEFFAVGIVEVGDFV